ncbi:MAG TPA: OmpH family outer membrane protein [Gammaproteobacteria bacterium]
MITKSLSLAVLLTASAVMASGAQAADLKIGAVKMGMLMEKSPQGAALKADMAKKFEGRQKDLVAEQDKLKTLQDQLNKNGATMSTSQVQDAQSQIDDLQRDFSRKASDFQDDAAMARNQALSTLQQDALKAVQEFAQAQKYNVILGDSVYADSSIDVTDQVLEQMKKDYQAANPGAAKSGD